MNIGKKVRSIVLPMLLFLLLGVLPENAFPRGKTDAAALPSAAQGAVPLTGTALDSGAPKMPRWVRDLRRGEIIAFGSFPFTFFMATTIMDSYRWIQHDGDQRYAPWPVKSAGAINMTKDETNIVIAAAAGGSILVSLADFIILRTKRNRAEREAASRPSGDPIIIRRPWPEAETSPDLPLSPEGENAPDAPSPISVPVPGTLEEGSAEAVPSGAEGS
ncbi:MAG: hypothetical protein LBD78_03035 [Spirochaetaceae bacterium]|jgi:hypothetical protein|nr:hypothetical protein [Spirochaetaceae bacterium]